MKRASHPSPRTSKRHKNNDEVSGATEIRRSTRGVPSAVLHKTRAESSPDESESDAETEFTTADLPEWLTSGLDDLKKQYPRDSFLGIFNSDGEPRVICSDCPGTQYLPGENDTSNFALHLRNKKHRTNVTTRLGPSSSPTITPSFKSRLYYESTLPFKLAASTPPPPHSLGSESRRIVPAQKAAVNGTSSGSGSGSGIKSLNSAAILPTSVLPTSSNLTPTARIAQLEKEGTEKGARIEELEGEVKRLGALVEGLLEREVGSGKGEGSTGTVRKTGFGSFFGGVF